MKKLPALALALNPVLWAAFYAFSKKAVVGSDPLVFSRIELTAAAAPALLLVVAHQKALSAKILVRSATLSLLLFGSVLCSTIALYYTTATNTAFFPALNGAIGAIISSIVLKEKLTLRTWSAVGVASCGALALIAASHHGGGSFAGDLIALLGVILYAIYIFTVDGLTPSTTTLEEARLLAGLELLLMALFAWMTIVWRNPTSSPGAGIMGLGCIIGLTTTFIPTLISLTLQRTVPPLQVAMLYVTEPLWGAAFAALVDGERLTRTGYFGATLIFAGSLLSLGSVKTSDHLSTLISERGSRMYEPHIERRLEDDVAR